MLVMLKNRFECLLRPVCEILQKCADFAEKHSAVLFWSSAILYRLLLDAVYIWAASPQYAYGGLVYTPVSWKYFISWAMYLLLFFLLPKREKDTTGFLLHLQFVYTVAPLLSFYALANGSSRYILMVFVCILLQILILRRPAGQKSAVSITGIRNYVTIMLGVLTAFALLVPILYNGFEGTKAFDFAYIYQMRANATYPPGFTYLFNWMQKVIIPFGVLYFLHLKKYRWCFLCVLIQVFFYMESGWKFTLFILIPVLAIYYISKSGHLIKLMYLGLFVLLLLVLLCYRLDRPLRLSSLGIYLNALIPIRAFFIPADIKFDFYEFFSIFPHTYFSDGMIGKLLGMSYPYTGSIGQLIFRFTGGTFLSSNSNTGYLGDSYAQMGFAGMLLMSLLLAAILRGVHNYESKENSSVLIALFSVFMILLNDSALFTTLLTNGMLVAFILVFVYFDKTSKGAPDGIQRI